MDTAGLSSEAASVVGSKIRKFQKPFTGKLEPIRVVNVYSSSRVYAGVCPGGRNVMLRMFRSPVPVTLPPELAQDGVLLLEASIFAKLKLIVRDEFDSTASFVHHRL